MTTTYDFVEQLERGKEYEEVLDAFFSQWYEIEPVTIQEERLGIDRLFKRGEFVTKVEYKADEKTQKTGNIFVETYSVVEQGRYGWAWTSKADIIAYLAIPDTIYIFKPQVLRRGYIEVWQKAFGVRTVKNKTYNSAGIPVPERVFKNACQKVMVLK